MFKKTIKTSISSEQTDDVQGLNTTDSITKLVKGELYYSNIYYNLNNYEKSMIMMKNYALLIKNNYIFKFALGFYVLSTSNIRYYYHNYYLCSKLAEPRLSKNGLINKDRIILCAQIVIDKINHYITNNISCLSDPVLNLNIKLNTYPSNKYFVDDGSLNLESTDIFTLFMTFIELKIDIYTFVFVFYLLNDFMNIYHHQPNKFKKEAEFNKVMNEIIAVHKDRQIIRLLLLLSEYQKLILQDYYKMILNMNKIFGKTMNRNVINEELDTYDFVLESPLLTDDKLYDFLSINAGKFFPQQERKKYQPNKTTLTRSKVVKSANKSTLKKNQKKSSNSSNNLFPL